MQKRQVSEKCWTSFETALARNDETFYDKSCDGQFERLEGYCDRLGDKAGADADCARGWGLVQQYPDFFAGLEGGLVLRSRKMVKEACWESLMNAIAAGDESVYDKSCEAEFEALEKRCEKLGDGAWEDEECAAGIAVAIALGGEDAGLALLGSDMVAQKTGLDWTAASIGAGVGFLAGYAIMKVRSGRKDDEFSRV